MLGLVVLCLVGIGYELKEIRLAIQAYKPR